MNASGSFIPEKKGKTGLVKRHRKVYILTYVTYVIFFGVSFAVAGLFLWGLYMSNQLAAQQENLRAESARFNSADIATVREFDQRLRHIRSLLNASPLVSELLIAVEESTPTDVRISRLTLEQAIDGGLSTVNAGEVGYLQFDTYKLTLETDLDDFDTALFHQRALEKNQVISVRDAAEVAVVDTASSNGEEYTDPISFIITAAVPFNALEEAVDNTNTTNTSGAPFESSIFDSGPTEVETSNSDTSVGFEEEAFSEQDLVEDVFESGSGSRASQSTSTIDVNTP